MKLPRVATLLESILDDLKHALQSLIQRPALTFLSVIALAVSIAITISTFATFNAFFFKPLPFKDSQQLKTIALRSDGDQPQPAWIPIDHFHLLGNDEVFSAFVGFYFGTINLSGDGRPARLDGTFVTPNFLEVLGHEVILGRAFSPDGTDVSGTPEILISHRVWQDRYRADPAIIGSTIRANGFEHVIVGVLPQGFHFPINSEVWVPVVASTRESGVVANDQVSMLGRVHEGISDDEALQALLAYYHRLPEDIQRGIAPDSIVVLPFGRLPVNKEMRYYYVLLIIVIALIVLISCANVANLLVGRSLMRAREIAIRAALGATRIRIIRQLLSESFVLVAMATVGGLLIAAWTVDLYSDTEGMQLPYFLEFNIDWRVLLFATVMMFVTTFIAGMVPAWQSSRTDLNEVLKDNNHTSTNFRLGKMTRLLAITQIAFSCALLFGAGLLIRYSQNLSRLDPGFEADQVLTMRMGLFPQDHPTAEARIAFFDELVARTKELPGVQGASVTSWLAMSGNMKMALLLQDVDQGMGDILHSYSEIISPDYFDLLQVELLAGRRFDARDQAQSPPVVVVNQAFVEQFMPGRNPIGERVFFPEKSEAREGGSSMKSAEIVGVVGNVRVTDYWTINRSEPITYLPNSQSDTAFMTLAVRSLATDKAQLADAIQQIVWQIDPNLPVYFIKTIQDYIDGKILPFKLIAGFFLFVGLLALFLSAIGVYGMIAFDVGRKRREIGIRMAIGANARDVARHVLRQGLLQVATGMLIGSSLAFLIGQLAKQFLNGINALDPLLYLAVILILLSVSGIAFFVPTRKATRLSPLEALRYE